MPDKAMSLKGTAGEWGCVYTYSHDGSCGEGRLSFRGVDGVSVMASDRWMQGGRRPNCGSKLYTLSLFANPCSVPSVVGGAGGQRGPWLGRDIPRCGVRPAL